MTPESRDIQIARHNAFCNEASLHAEDWRKKEKVSKYYSKYRDKFVDVLLKFQSMWDIHLGCINAAKHRIERISECTKIIDKAPYRAGPEPREIGKTKTEIMIA